MSVSMYLRKEDTPVSLLFVNKQATPNEMLIRTVACDVEKVKQLYEACHSGDDYSVAYRVEG